MLKRKIISIDEERCDGCGLCAEACHERAIEMVDGKARLISDSYCDGLGDCLPACPRGAITMITREADPFDEEAVQARIQAYESGCTRTCVVPGEKKVLNQWPIQLHLLHPRSPFLADARLLIAADCTAFARPELLGEILEDRITLIGCPKLDQITAYVEKLQGMFQHHTIQDLLIARMEVPCCGGMVTMVERALEKSGKDIPLQIITIGIDGTIKAKKGDG